MKPSLFLVSVTTNVPVWKEQQQTNKQNKKRKKKLLKKETEKVDREVRIVLWNFIHN